MSQQCEKVQGALAGLKTARKTETYHVRKDFQPIQKRKKQLKSNTEITWLKKKRRKKRETERKKKEMENSF